VPREPAPALACHPPIHPPLPSAGLRLSQSHQACSSTFRRRPLYHWSCCRFGGGGYSRKDGIRGPIPCSSRLRGQGCMGADAVAGGRLRLQMGRRCRAVAAGWYVTFGMGLAPFWQSSEALLSLSGGEMAAWRSLSDSSCAPYCAQAHHLLTPAAVYLTFNGAFGAAELCVHVHGILFYITRFHCVRSQRLSLSVVLTSHLALCPAAPSLKPAQMCSTHRRCRRHPSHRLLPI